MKLVCFKCSNEIALVGTGVAVGRRDECPKCRSDLHVCKNCQHYDAKVYNECRETSADVVREKDRANFCDFFVPGGQGAKKDDAAALKAKAEALFKK
jgi:hypothetical protein